MPLRVSRAANSFLIQNGFVTKFDKNSKLIEVWPSLERPFTDQHIIGLMQNQLAHDFSGNGMRAVFNNFLKEMRTQAQKQTSQSGGSMPKIGRP